MALLAAGLACSPAEVDPPRATGSERPAALAGTGSPAATDLPRPGGRREVRLAAGAAAAYRVELAAGGFLHAVVEQRALDVAVTLIDPSGGAVLAVDGLGGPEGPELVAAVAAVDGVHRLEVRAPAGVAAGGFELRVVARRPAGEADRRLARAVAAHERGEALWGAGQLEDARLAYGEALEAVAGLDQPLLAARARRRSGQVLLARGEVGAAVERLEAVREALQAHGNGWEVGPFLRLLGEAYRLAARPRAARESYQEALEIAEGLGHGAGVAAAANGLGALHESLGDLQTALGFYERALEERRRLGNPGREAAALHNLGGVYVRLGRLEEGLELLRRSLARSRGAGLQGSEATTLTSIAWVRYLQGDPQAALAAYDEALAVQRDIGDRQGEAYSLERIGRLHLAAGQAEAALAVLRQALELVRGSGSRLAEAHTLAALGRAQTAAGEPAAALARLSRALELFRRVGDLSGEAAVLAAAASAERLRGERTAALELFEQSLALLETVRGRIQATALRRSFFAGRYADHRAYVELLAELADEQPGRGWEARAFEASERARARGLLEDLAARGALEHRVPPRLAQRRRGLTAAIAAREGRRIELAAGGAAPQTLERLDTEIGALLLELEMLSGEIRAAAPGAEPRPLTLAEVGEQVLDDETLLLTYFLGEERGVVWLVRRGRPLVSEPLPPRAQVEELARQVVTSLRKRGGGARSQRQASAAALSEAVLGPVREHLGGERLVIVADGALQTVPFAALPRPGASGEAGEPLVVEHEVVHLPSASVLAQLRRAPRRPASKLLAMLADPIYRPDDPRLGDAVGVAAEGVSSAPASDLERSAEDTGPQRFPRLRFSAREASAVLGLAGGGESLDARGARASRELVLAGQLAPYRIVHFAAHGELHRRHPALSGLVLSLYGADGQPRDGFLRLYEVFELELSAELVVLSACQTALGEALEGEGLVGLPQAFFHAGAERVVVSLWNVDDRATAVLMERFYRGLLRDGLRPAAALRRAQLSMLAEEPWRSPYYWAGFVLQGEWR